MGIMAYSSVLVIRDVYQQPYGLDCTQEPTGLRLEHAAMVP